MVFQVLLTSGNTVKNEWIIRLKERIEKINSLTREELKAHYLDTIENNEMSPEGNAGLGLIEMAKKSGNCLTYSIDNIDDKLSFYTLKVLINI